MCFNQELEPTLQEGKARISDIKALSEKVQPQTDKEGQAALQRQLGGLVLDWENYKTGLNETRQLLETGLTSWNQYETLYEGLSRWMKEMETQAKDCQSKPSLEDKANQLQLFKVNRNS